MTKAQCVNMLYLASLLLSCTGLLVLGGGVWLVEEYQADTEAAQMIKDEFEIKTEFTDYYSVFNKKGGWTNLAYVMIGVGAVSFVLAFLGFIGIHEETIFLVLTYITLLLIVIMLNIASVIIIIRRDSEMKIFQEVTKQNASVLVSEKFIYFVFSLSFSALALAVSVTAAVGRNQGDGEKKISMETA